MSQQKKSQFEICPRLTDKIANQIRKADKSMKGRPSKDALKMMFEFSPDLLHSLDFIILAEEYFWERSGYQTIFPENSLVLDNLFKARYHLENAAGIDMPFESFILAMPQGYKIDGYQIPSCLVTWIPYQQSQHDTIFPFCDHIRIPKPSQVNHEPSGEHERGLSITFRDRNSSITYNRALTIESKLPDILKAKNIYEFNQILGKYDDHTFQNVIASDEYDLQIQFRLFKLIAALAVYHQATEGDRLHSGFPGSLMPKIIGKDESQRLKMSTLKNTFPVSASKVSPEVHVRTWFIRQLNNERFYRGQYEKMRMGSRYVFVKETTVNGKLVAYTQN
jgi:hypothetical protein